MNENDKIDNEINYYSASAMAFTIKEVADFSAEYLNPVMLRERLLGDKRFISIIRLDNAELFISKTTLIEWLVYLNVHLANIRYTQLTEKQLSFLIESLVDYGDHKKILEAIVIFGQDSGLISFSKYSGKYIFPIAHILSFVNTRAGNLLGILNYAVKNLNVSFEEQADGILKNILFELDEREKYILQAREGIFGAKKQTLLEISNHLGVTRERVRQLEKSIHNRKALIRPFLTALLQDLIRNGGNLLFNSESPSTKIKSVFARYIGIPMANATELNMCIMGASRISLDSAISSLEVERVAEWITANNKTLCLVDRGVISMVNSYISYWHDNSKLIDKIYIALKAIGEPAHYSMICKKYNSLFPKHRNKENNIHSALLRGQLGIVWVGAKGMFALDEWGFKRPEETLLRTAAIIVENRYNQSRKAVPYDFVVTEFKKHRKFINESSLKMSLYNNPELVQSGYDSFLPKNTEDSLQDYTNDESISLNLKDSGIQQELAIQSSFLDELTYREREIIKLRHGIDTTHFHTYEEIGRVFRISVSVVKEVEEIAIEKLQMLTKNGISNGRQ